MSIITAASVANKMPLELSKQVTSRGLSEYFKKKNVPQNSQFYWYRVTRCETKEKQVILSHPDTFAAGQYPQFYKEKILCSAFTLSEIEQFLPFDTVFYREKNGRNPYAAKNPRCTAWGETRIESAASNLYWLLSNKFIKFPKES